MRDRNQISLCNCFHLSVEKIAPFFEKIILLVHTCCTIDCPKWKGFFHFGVGLRTRSVVNLFVDFMTVNLNILFSLNKFFNRCVHGRQNYVFPFCNNQYSPIFITQKTHSHWNLNAKWNRSQHSTIRACSQSRRFMFHTSAYCSKWNKMFLSMTFSNVIKMLIYTPKEKRVSISIH